MLLFTYVVKWVAFRGYACTSATCGGIQPTYANAEAASIRDASHTHLVPHVDMLFWQRREEKPYEEAPAESCREEGRCRGKRGGGEKRVFLFTLFQP
jgi:hypothetical protein